MNRYPVDTLDELGRVRLSETTSHHLLVVRRHRRGDALILFDGTGAEADGTLARVENGVAVIDVTRIRRPASVPPMALHLLLGIPKGPALEHAIRMAVEIGVTELHLAIAERSVRRNDRSDRWQRVVASACQQCGRTTAPELHPLQSLTAALDRFPTDVNRYVGTRRGTTTAARPSASGLAIGPEGGFTRAELQSFEAHGWQTLDLGPHILRTDTAVAVGLAIVRPPHRLRGGEREADAIPGSERS